MVGTADLRLAIIGVGRMGAFHARSLAGVDGTAAHIHQGAAGTNGPVIVTLTKILATRWSVPPGTKLTEAQDHMRIVTGVGAIQNPRVSVTACRGLSDKLASRSFGAAPRSKLPGAIQM